MLGAPDKMVHHHKLLQYVSLMIKDRAEGEATMPSASWGTNTLINFRSCFFFSLLRHVGLGGIGISYVRGDLALLLRPTALPSAKRVRHRGKTHMQQYTLCPTVSYRRRVCPLYLTGYCSYVAATLGEDGRAR
jgi:hypothetical protein